MSQQTPPQTVDEAIDQAAKNPLTVSIAGHSVTSRSIDDLIKAAQHQAGQNGANKKGFGFRFQIAQLPGAWE